MAKELCIDSRIMGTERNLLVADGYRWIEHVPSGSWHLSGEIKLGSDRCLDTALRLAGKTISVTPPARFVNAMSTLLHDQNAQIPWSHVMPAREHRAFVKNIINEATESMDNISTDYYVNTWVPESMVLRALQPACIDVKRFEHATAESGMNSRVIDGFKPVRGNYANNVEYDRFGSRTGRLTVNRGPNILTLKKEHRNMITPSEHGGSILYVDFAALEARVLLYEAGGRCDDVDMYTFISKQLFGGAAPRNAVKLAVISELYGSSKHTLSEALGIEGKELNNFIGKVKRFFRTKELLKRIKGEFIKTGRITNRYGRSLVIEEPLDHILINTYAQSTGVDVSLLGFSNIIDQLKHLHEVRPLFVLHDALVLDVAPENVEDVKKITHVKVPGYVQRFPVKCESLS